MSNLTEIYKEKTFPIEDVTIGMRLRVGDYIGNRTMYPIKKGTIGTVTEVRPCRIDRCNAPKDKCKAHAIVLMLDGYEGVETFSCYYTFTTLDGIPIVVKEEA